MHIGMISYYLPSDSKIGSGYQAHYLANALVRRGHQVTMHSPAPRPDDALYALTRIDVGTSQRMIRFARNLRHIDWQGFDILHAHGEDYLLHTRRRPPHVRTMHGSCFAEARYVPGFKEKLRMVFLGVTEVLAYWAADATVGVSTNTTRSFPWIKRVIPNGVDTAAFCPGTEKEPVPTILFVGTYRNRKRGRLLMEIFAQTILPVLPEARLWMVCSDAPAAPHVEVLGRLTTAELADRYRRAWVFCLPSSYEGFGVPYIEAMASGTPVLATPNVGAAEVLDGGRYGLLAPPANLGPALLRLLQSPEERSRLAQAGLERVRAFAWDTVAAQYETLYASLRANSPAAGLEHAR